MYIIINTNCHHQHLTHPAVQMENNPESIEQKCPTHKKAFILKFSADQFITGCKV